MARNIMEGLTGSSPSAPESPEAVGEEDLRRLMWLFRHTPRCVSLPCLLGFGLSPSVKRHPSIESKHVHTMGDPQLSHRMVQPPEHDDVARRFFGVVMVCRLQGLSRLVQHYATASGADPHDNSPSKSAQAGIRGPMHDLLQLGVAQLETTINAVFSAVANVVSRHDGDVTWIEGGMVQCVWRSVGEFGAFCLSTRRRVLC